MQTKQPTIFQQLAAAARRQAEGTTTNDDLILFIKHSGLAEQMMKFKSNDSNK